MTATHKEQYARSLYLSHYLGASLAHLVKLAFTLPFRPTVTHELTHHLEYLLDDSIGASI